MSKPTAGPGTPTGPKPCPKCRHGNPDDALYCERCGGALETAATDSAPASGSERQYTIGRDPKCDIFLDQPMVSTAHAVLLERGGGFYIRDQGSTNGTFHNDAGRRIWEARIEPGDRLFFGSYPVDAARILRMAQFDPRRPGPLLPVPAGGLAFGPDGDPRTGDPRTGTAAMAGDLCAIVPENRTVILKIPAKTPGIFLNGAAVGSDRELCVGDHLVIGNYTYVLEPFGLRGRGRWTDFRLDVRTVSAVVHPDQAKRRKLLLDRVSLVIYPGELCGLMGIAGSGKSSLLKTANGYREPEYGRVSINELDLYRHYDFFKMSLGYVPQDDIFHKELTVGQALGFAARIRMDRSMSREEVAQLTDKVLTRLNLFEANPQIKTTAISAVSGGQRRRLNIAIELLTDPGMFFLDEPTSGLSSEDALVVMSLLRDMAREGKTVLVSLHQPSREIYGMLDNVIFLHTGGKLAYYGPAQPDSILFVQEESGKPKTGDGPEAVLRAIDRKPGKYWRRKYLESPYAREFVDARQFDLSSAEPQKRTGRFDLRQYLRQWWVFQTRNFAVRLQDRMLTSILLLQSPVIAFLFVLVFGDQEPDRSYEDAPLLVFLMVIAAVWFGCINAARDICGEWPIYLRERMYNLKIVPYVAAKMTVGACIALVQCWVHVAIVVYFCDLGAPLPAMFLVLWAASVAGTGLGLLISAFASPFKKRNEIAIFILPIVLLPMVILAGIIKPYKDMNVPTRFASELTITRWGYESALVLEARYQDEPVTFGEGEITVTKSKYDLILSPSFAEDQRHPWPVGVLVMAAMAVLLLLATVLYLKARDPIPK